MSKENADKRPPFMNYVRVRHTGFSPFKLNPNTFPFRGRREPLSTRNPPNGNLQRPHGATLTTKVNPTREVVRRKPAERRHAIPPENSGPVINEENTNTIISNAEENIQTFENAESITIELNTLESNQNEPPVDENIQIYTEIEQNAQQITPLNTEQEQNVPQIEENTPIDTDSEGEFIENDFATELSNEESTPQIENNFAADLLNEDSTSQIENDFAAELLNEDSTSQIENDFHVELSNENIALPQIFQQTSSPCLDEITFSFMGLHVGEEEVIIEVNPIISGLNINEDKEFSSFETCISEIGEIENIQVETLHAIPSCSNTQNQINSEVLIEDTLTDLENNKENIQPLVIVENKQEGEVESIYRLKLETETARLSKLANTMDSYKKNSMPTNILDEIDSIVGQTRLLIRSKFKQFSSLIDTFSSNKLKPEDLEGFWEMMYIQVDQLNDKFAKLDQLKDAGWVVKEENQKPKKKIHRGGAKRNKKYKNIQSRIKLNKDNSNVTLVPSTPKTPSKARHDALEETFRNDVLSRTPKLLVNKNILNAKNSRRTSLDIVVRQSLLGKLL